jgi:hypothetical protein
MIGPHRGDGFAVRRKRDAQPLPALTEQRRAALLLLAEIDYLDAEANVIIASRTKGIRLATSGAATWVSRFCGKRSSCSFATGTLRP